MIGELGGREILSALQQRNEGKKQCLVLRQILRYILRNFMLSQQETVQIFYMITSEIPWGLARTSAEYTFAILC